MSTKQALQKTPEGILQVEEKKKTKSTHEATGKKKSFKNNNQANEEEGGKPQYYKIYKKTGINTEFSIIALKTNSLHFSNKMTKTGRLYQKEETIIVFKKCGPQRMTDTLLGKR